MRLYELENNVSVDQILNDCSPYLNYIGYKSQQIPLRDIGMSPDGDIMYLETQEKRESLILGGGIVTRLIDDYMERHGHAKRYSHTVIASSSGDNNTFTMDDDSTGSIIPIGDFKVSYIDDQDFNDSDDIGNLQNHISLLKNIIRDSDLRRTMDGMVQAADDEDKEKIEKYSKRMEQYTDNNHPLNEILNNVTLETIGDALKTFADERGIDSESEPMKYINKISMLANVIVKRFTNTIHNDNLQKAFTSEHEIWFNCKAYYYINCNSSIWTELMDRLSKK